jgi:hypothetical protein
MIHVKGGSSGSARAPAAAYRRAAALTELSVVMGER